MLPPFGLRRRGHHRLRRPRNKGHLIESRTQKHWHIEEADTFLSSRGHELDHPAQTPTVTGHGRGTTHAFPKCGPEVRGTTLSTKLTNGLESAQKHPDWRAVESDGLCGLGARRGPSARHEIFTVTCGAVGQASLLATHNEYCSRPQLSSIQLRSFFEASHPLVLQSDCCSSVPPAPTADLQGRHHRSTRAEKGMPNTIAAKLRAAGLFAGSGGCRPSSIAPTSFVAPSTRRSSSAQIHVSSYQETTSGVYEDVAPGHPDVTFLPPGDTSLIAPSEWGLEPTPLALASKDSFAQLALKSTRRALEKTGVRLDSSSPPPAKSWAQFAALYSSVRC